jgi:hypothetical protein
VTAAKKPALIDRRGPSSGLDDASICREIMRLGSADPAVGAAFTAVTGELPCSPMTIVRYVEWLVSEYCAFRESDVRVRHAIALLQQAALTADREQCRELHRKRLALEGTFSRYENDLYVARLRIARLRTETPKRSRRAR